MTHFTLQGGCHCGNLRIDIELPRPAASYIPRACDCDYCRKHGAAWLSDPTGRLALHVRAPAELGRYRQGAGLADFLLCKGCGVVVAVTYTKAGRTWATVNSRAIDGTPDFPAATPVSPRTLGPEEKVARWKAVWFADAMFQTTGTPE